MAVSFFPFNSIVVNGVADRAANAENLAAYLAGFFSDGVIMDEDTALQVKVDSGMRLQILAGTGVINGKTILNTTAASITIEAASATLKRIDRVIFRLDENNRLMEFDVLKGTAASSPTAPALTRSGGIYEMCLAEVLVPAGATSILASYITDTRADKNLCGSAAASAIESAIKQLNAVEITKVWGNASLISNFPAQSIPVDLSDADLIIYQACYATDTTNVIETTFVAPNSRIITRVLASAAYANVGYNTRIINFENSQIVFEDNYLKQINTASGGTKNDKYNIPLAAYKVKGVQ